MREKFISVPEDGTEKQTTIDHSTYPLGRVACFMAGALVGKTMAKYAGSAAHRALDKLDLTGCEDHPQSSKVLLFKTLAESYGVNVSTEHLSYWRSMLTVTSALDDIIDNTQPDSLNCVVNSLLNGEAIPGISEGDAEEFYSYVENASRSRHDIIMEGLDNQHIADELASASSPEEKRQLRRREGDIFTQKIEDITSRMRTTTDPKELLILRREEAAIYGRIMTIDNTVQDPSVDAFNEGFLKLCETGYLLDSFIDLARDYKDGVTVLKPSPSNYLALGREVLPSVCSSILPLPKLTIAKLAVISFKKSVRKKLKSPSARIN